MKKFSTLLALAVLTLGSASAQYSPCCDPCETSCGPSFRVGADFLYWKPNIDDLEFAAVSTTTETVTTIAYDSHYHNICPNWTPGIRAYIDATLCNFDLSLSYTYLSIDEKRHLDAVAPAFITSPIMHGTLFQPDEFGLFRTANSEYQAKYHNWDILGNLSLFDCGCLQVNGFVGVAGLYLDQRWDTVYDVPEVDPLLDYVDSRGTVHWDSTLGGIGLKAGTSLDYTLCRSLTLFGSASASLLTANPDSSTVQTAVFDDLDNRLRIHDDKNQWIIVPGYHLQAGIRYGFNACGCEIGVRAGYEFLGWCNIPNLRRFMSEIDNGAALGTSANTTTFGLQGLFVGADIGF